MRLVIFSISLFFSNFILGQNTLRALFIGNSYMGVNNLPSMVSDLSTSLGDVLLIDSNTPGGQTFQNHAANPINYQKMAEQPWDYIILQGQSQEPSFPYGQVNAQTLPYAVQLADSAKAIHSDSTLQASASYSSIPGASLLSFSATANKAANFTWYFPDGSIETGPTIGFEYNLSSYQVLLVAEGLCDTDSVLIEVTNPNAGLSATAALQWKMTGPNSIEIRVEKNLAVEAFDVLGRKCPMEIENNGVNSLLSFSNKAAFIKIQTTNGSTIIRVPIFLH